MAYIPKSNIKFSSTKDNSFVYKSSPQVSYQGEYIETSEGRYFAGRNPIDLSVEIIKKEKKELPRPNILTPTERSLKFGNSLSFKQHRILKGGIHNTLKQHEPINFIKNIPTEQDYKKGFFNRYFLKRKNADFDYKEIDFDTYDAIVKEDSKYDTNLYVAGFMKWSLKEPNQWITNAQQLTLQQQKGFLYLWILFPKFNEFAKVTNWDFSGDLQRYYPDGEEIPPSLPPAYAIPDSPGFNLLENNAIPNINPKCLNCVFNKENHCTKWNATIRPYYWCKAWGPVIPANVIGQYNFTNENFYAFISNQLANMENTYASGEATQSSPSQTSSTSLNLNTSPSERPQIPTGNANDGSPGDDFIPSGNTRPPTTSTPPSGGGGGGY